MIMALGAADGQAEEHGADVAREVVERVLAGQRDDRRVALIGPHPQVAGGDLGVDVVGKELVPRKLLAKEPVVRHVPVEGAEDVVAVFPGQRAGRVVVVTGRLREPDEVEPHPAPRLPVMRIGQKPIEEPLVGIDGRVGLELVDLLRSGGKPEQVELGAADQFSPAGRRRKRRAPGIPADSG